MERKYCVYVHTNTINGKKYVGMTSQAPERRWGTNGRGYKQNLYFSSEIQEYGWDNFKHEIVADNMTFDEACEKEIMLIERFCSACRDKGYNEELGGLGKGRASDSMREHNRKIQLKRFEDATERQKRSEQTKAYFSVEANRKRQSELISKFYLEHPERRKPVQMFSLNGEYIDEFGSAWETGRYGFDASHVKACCKGKRKTAGGYIWRYSNELQNKAI